MALELSGSSAQEIDQIGRSMKWVRDDRAVWERHRSEKLSVDFGEQDGVQRRLGAVERGQSRKRLLVAG